MFVKRISLTEELITNAPFPLVTEFASNFISVPSTAGMRTSLANGTEAATAQNKKLQGNDNC
jgi:hypothetical protein